VFSNWGILPISMDRAEHALCWRPFMRQIGDRDALKLYVAHQIKAYQCNLTVGLACFVSILASV
jgi:hypothetical protein